MQRAHFDGSSQIGAYVKLTNSYLIIGATHTSQFRKSIEDLVDVPIVETTINSISAVGRQIQGNKHGLLLPMTTQNHELMVLRQELPESIRIRRIDERLNALGNVLLCNDHVAIVHPEVDNDTLEIIENVLCVTAYKMCIGNEPLVGSYGTMNNQGLLVGPGVGDDELKGLTRDLGLQVVAGTVNMGAAAVGGGIVVNDWIGFCGKLTSNPEISVMENVFMLKDTN